MRPAARCAGPLALVIAALVACAPGDENPAAQAPADPGGSGPAATAAATPRTLAFPTGPAVLVAPGYVPPGDRVDSTGAFLPANGKPTLVFVDAIW